MGGIEKGPRKPQPKEELEDVGREKPLPEAVRHIRAPWAMRVSNRHKLLNELAQGKDVWEAAVLSGLPIGTLISSANNWSKRIYPGLPPLDAFKRVLTELERAGVGTHPGSATLEERTGVPLAPEVFVEIFESNENQEELPLEDVAVQSAEPPEIESPLEIASYSQWPGPNTPISLTPHEPIHLSPPEEWPGPNTPIPLTRKAEEIPAPQEKTEAPDEAPPEEVPEPVMQPRVAKPPATVSPAYMPRVAAEVPPLKPSQLKLAIRNANIVRNQAARTEKMWNKVLKQARTVLKDDDVRYEIFLRLSSVLRYLKGEESSLPSFTGATIPSVSHYLTSESRHSPEQATAEMRMLHTATIKVSIPSIKSLKLEEDLDFPTDPNTRKAQTGLAYVLYTEFEALKNNQESIFSELFDMKIAERIVVQVDESLSKGRRLRYTFMYPEYKEVDQKE